MDGQELIQRYHAGQRDFSGVDLHGVQLERVNTGDEWPKPIDLRGICLHQANLTGVKFYNVRLNDADLSGADLRNANLGGCTLTGADLSDAKLQNAELPGADLGGATLARANLRGALIFETNLYGADLHKANLREADLSKSDLREAHLTDAILGGTTLPDLIDEDQLARVSMLDISPGQSYVEAMKDWVDYKFVSQGLPGFDSGYEMGLDDLQVYLRRYGVDPYDAEGQAVITHYTDHALNEWYGDFYHFNNCSVCGKEFQPVYDLEYAYQVLDGFRVLCPACRKGHKQ